MSPPAKLIKTAPATSTTRRAIDRTDGEEDEEEEESSEEEEEREIDENARGQTEGEVAVTSSTNFTYSPPEAPPLDEVELEDVSPKVKQPRDSKIPPLVTYLVNDEACATILEKKGSVYFMLRGIKYQDFGAIALDNYVMVKFNPQQTKNLQYRLRYEIRNVMHDGGPVSGYEAFKITPLIKCVVDTEYSVKLNIREMFVTPKNTRQCTKRGFLFSKSEVDRLLQIVDEICVKWGDMRHIDEACFERHVKQPNQQDLIDCQYCDYSIPEEEN